MEQTIMRSMVMAEINTGKPFTLEFVTADQRRGVAGKLIECRNWIRLSLDLPGNSRPGNWVEKFKRILNTRETSNKIFVIFNPANPAAHPITVHYWLMISFNGKRIING